MSEHEVVFGCLYELEDGAICHCGNDPAYIANDKLAALLTAGNAMADELRSCQYSFGILDKRTAAIAAWESVTK